MCPLLSGIVYIFEKPFLAFEAHEKPFTASLPELK